LAAMEHRVPYDQQPFRVSDTRCGFFVDVTIVADREYIVRTVTNSDGTVTERVTGHLVETLTNVSDPSKSVTLNVSGPFTVQLRPDGSAVFVDAQGPNVSFFSQASQNRFGVPGILYSTGRLVRTFDAAVPHPVTSVSLSGNGTDVCALLR
jgi:hypothetical protein